MVLTLPIITANAPSFRGRLVKSLVILLINKGYKYATSNRVWWEDNYDFLLPLAEANGNKKMGLVGLG
jgi:hypothetical protein